MHSHIFFTVLKQKKTAPLCSSSSSSSSQAFSAQLVDGQLQWILQACGRGTIQQQGIWSGSKLGANQSHGSQLGANQSRGSELGANQPHGYRASRLKPQQLRQSVRLGLKRKQAGSASSSANGSALPHDPQPYDTPTDDAGGCWLTKSPHSESGLWQMHRDPRGFCHLAHSKLTMC